MRKYNFILMISIFSLILSSCDNALTEKLVFDAKVDSATADTIIKDTIFVRKATPVSFKFSGNPQFISYFSGEPGNEYKYYNVTSIPINEFDSCFLKFDITPVGIDGNIDNTLFLLISDKFSGISGSASTPAFSTDSTNIRNKKDYNWTDLTPLCMFPTVSTTKKSVKLDMMSYLGKNISLKFKYLTTRNDMDQPKWTIANLKFVRYQKGKTPVELLSQALAFKPFDILNSATAYSVSGPGVWSKSNPTNMYINTTLAGNPVNEDYLVSTPTMINPLTTTSTGALVKNLSVDVTSFSYTYTSKGIYTATFSATNVNYMDSGQYKQVSFIIKVID